MLLPCQLPSKFSENQDTDITDTESFGFQEHVIEIGMLLCCRRGSGCHQAHTQHSQLSGGYHQRKVQTGMDMCCIQATPTPFVPPQKCVPYLSEVVVLLHVLLYCIINTYYCKSSAVSHPSCLATWNHTLSLEHAYNLQIISSSVYKLITNNAG